MDIKSTESINTKEDLTKTLKSESVKNVEDNTKPEQNEVTEDTKPKLSVEVVENKKKKNKNGWKKAKKNTWIYIEHLPKSVTEEQLFQTFSKFGIIQQNSLGDPRIKLYRNENNEVKGDASICYLREESVITAIDIMDDTKLNVTDEENIKVSAAVFEQKENFVEKRGAESSKALKVRKLQQEQSLNWNEDDVDNDHGLKIIVLENVFDLSQTKNPSFVKELENDMLEGCSAFGSVQKITVFDTNPNGVVVVKFDNSVAAEECIKKMNGRYFAGRQLRSFFWDGVTNYKTRLTLEEEEARLDAFVKSYQNDDE